MLGHREQNSEALACCTCFIVLGSLVLSILAIVYGSIILDANIGASGHKLHLWVNCLVHVIHMALSMCEGGSNKSKDKADRSTYAGLIGLALLIWDIIIWTQLPGSYDYYHTQYPDLLILFKVYSIFGFIMSGLVVLTLLGFLVIV